METRFVLSGSTFFKPQSDEDINKRGVVPLLGGDSPFLQKPRIFRTANLVGLLGTT